MSKEVIRRHLHSQANDLQYKQSQRHMVFLFIGGGNVFGVQNSGHHQRDGTTQAVQYRNPDDDGGASQWV